MLTFIFYFTFYVILFPASYGLWESLFLKEGNKYDPIGKFRQAKQFEQSESYTFI